MSRNEMLEALGLMKLAAVQDGTPVYRITDLGKRHSELIEPGGEIFHKHKDGSITGEGLLSRLDEEMDGEEPAP